ncbi:unnamed protein product, partial [Cladocopium goreaui]
VIYTDGSSQSRKRHCSPLWTDLHDVSDSWCFAVFAEQYTEDTAQEERQLEFIGDHLRVAHTRSHAGEPFNELVDFFAKLEGRNSLYLPRQQINMQTFGRILRILWIILPQDGDLPTLCEGGIAITPPEVPTTMVCPDTTEKVHLLDKIIVTLSFASANVRTFYWGQDGVPGKLHYVREQFQHQHLHFLGLQETRTSQCSATAESVLRLASGDRQGQQGVELWVNLKPYGWHNQVPLCFSKSHVVVTHTSPRYLLAHVCNEHVDFWIAVIYAPQSGISHSEREEWWHTMTTLLHTIIGDRDLVLLIDANAATGEADDQHAFHNDDKATSSTPLLRDLLVAQRLCLPATSDRHQGDQETWICPATNHGHRIDYVAIPKTWLSSCTISRTIPELDLGNLGDHTAVGLEVQWTQFSRREDGCAIFVAFKQGNSWQEPLRPGRHLELKYQGKSLAAGIIEHFEGSATHSTRALRHKYFGPTATGKMHVLTENGNREITVVVYGTESWTLMDKANKHYFHSAYMRLYRRLLKIQPDQPLTDDELLSTLSMPAPTTVLRVSRLRYLALLYKCASVTPWAVLRKLQQHLR